MSRTLCNCSHIDRWHIEGTEGCVTQVSMDAAETGTEKVDESTPSFIRDALDELTLTLALKNSDYKIDGEFSNFEFAADVAQLEVVDVMMTQIGIKLGRIKGTIKNQLDYNYESLGDSVRDLAGYAVIMYAYYLSKESRD